MQATLAQKASHYTNITTVNAMKKFPCIREEVNRLYTAQKLTLFHQRQHHWI